MSDTRSPGRRRKADADGDDVLDLTTPGGSGRARSGSGGTASARRWSMRAAFKHPLANYGFLLGATLLLLVIGLVMVLSASTVVSFRGTGSSYTLFWRQVMFAVAGLFAMFVLSRRSPKFFERLATPAMIIAFVMLLLVLVPGIGVEVNGQRNWISLGGPFRLQPSEFAKFALIIWTASIITAKRSRIDGWRELIFPLAPVAGAMIALVLLEGDLGTTLVMMPIVAAILLVAGAPLRLFAVMGAGIGALILLMSVTTPYRLQRFASWLDPASDPDGTGWQVLHGQYALATGGWWGVGLGASREKWGFLPEAQTDFILAVIGEELGLVGTMSVVGLFVVIAIAIIQIGMRTQSEFIRLATVGVGIWVVAQALINIGAVVGALPITGLPLPLVSYGGSSLTFTLMAIGMLLAFARADPRAAEYLAARRSIRSPGSKSRRWFILPTTRRRVRPAKPKQSATKVRQRVPGEQQRTRGKKRDGTPEAQRRTRSRRRRREPTQ